jgi:hypothetical protein
LDADVRDIVFEIYLARILPTPALLPTGGVDFSTNFRSERRYMVILKRMN